MSEDLTKKLPSSDSHKILQQIDSRLQSLEQKVEERLYDTRPIWQKVVADIAQLQQGQVELQQGQVQLQQGQVQLQQGQVQLQQGQAQFQEAQSRLEGDVRDIKISMRDMTRKMGGLYESMVGIQAEYRELNHRILDIELEHQKQRNSQT